VGVWRYRLTAATDGALNIAGDDTSLVCRMICQPTPDLNK